ncbi:hypothetical protein [Paenibacillus xylaniclasticus]|uniref:hypothetical protein n=1 Tax=Paenibacillus xylaniclasticus TaxID=588083 RepID=UPI000FDC1B26|nr:MULTISPECIES: hypothetical protein [Paenibacillus]GFN33092.1 hypothetical protein PCURB6_33520 [Paenibacillus curdlanolyticus]
MTPQPITNRRPGAFSPPPPGSKALIKLAIGRLLIDTAVDGCPFDIREHDGHWTIEVIGVTAEQAAFIQANAPYLNLFYFEGLPEGNGAVQKFWMYDQDQPKVSYDEKRKRLTLTVDSYMAYSNEKV